MLPPDDVLTLDTYLGKGPQPGEETLPEDAATTSVPAASAFDEGALAQLEGMGLPLVRCQRVLLATGNAGAEGAMECLCTHMDNPGQFFSLILD